MADWVNDDSPEDDSRDGAECPCCGWIAFEGEVFDGAELLCGCAGQVSVDAESAYVVIDDEEPCPPHAKCQEASND